jgi:hypothetical protein
LENGNPAIRAGYGFGWTIAGYYRYGSKINRGNKSLVLSWEDIDNKVKNFIEQLGPSGYLDDGP